MGLKELAEVIGCGGHRQIGHIDIHVWSLGEMRQTIARSSKQYAATIPRRRNGETQHEDQRRGPMIPSDRHTLPKKTAWRYVFLGRPRRVPDHAALQMGLTCSCQALGFVRDEGYACGLGG
jgi:hypothetical protein